MPQYTDSTGHTVTLDYPPLSMVSLVPSQTELLYDLGLTKEVIGITKFCVHPKEWFDTKVKVGGTKNIHLKKIAALKPQLIIANKEENVQEQIAILEKEFPVYTTDVSTYNDALEMILKVGELCGKALEAKNLVKQIETAFKKVKSIINERLQAVYLIWKDPYMTVGGDTFINGMMEKGGFENIFNDRKRYPQITLDEIKAAKPDAILLSTEPYPFKQRHVEELKKNLPESKIILVDGELFSWYGSRMLLAPPYFLQLQQRIKAL